MKIGEKNISEMEVPTVSLAQSGAGQTSAPAEGTLSAATLERLLQVMLLRETRLTQNEEQEQERRDARKAQYRRNSISEDTAIIEKQQACRHLKGGSVAGAIQKTDYALSMHTFIDKTTRIKCLLCSASWFPYDTAEWLVRGGKAVRNHTGIGWTEALRMMGQSSNTLTTSEIPLVQPKVLDDPKRDIAKRAIQEAEKTESASQK